MKSILTFISIILFYINLSFAQENHLIDFEQKLDSLLISGNLSNIAQIILENKNVFNDSSAYNSLVEPYLSLLLNIQNTVAFDSIRQKNMSEEYNKLYNMFDESIAGTASVSAYKKFSINYNENRISDAIKFYLIAYYLKIKYIQKMQDRFNSDFYQIKQNFSKSEYNLVIIAIEDIRQWSKPFYFFQQKEDSLKYYEEKSQNRQYELLEFNKDYQEQSKVESEFQFTISPQLVYTPALNNISWSIDNKYNPEDLYIKKIPSAFGGCFRISADYKITNNFAAGSQFRMGYFSFGSIVEPGSFTIIKVDHNLKYNGIYAYGRYYFRNKFGAQPYLDLGLGYVSYERKKIEMFLDDGPELVNIASKSFKSMQLLIDFGIDYVYKNTLPFVFGFEINGYYNTKRSDISSQIIYSVSFNLSFQI